METEMNMDTSLSSLYHYITKKNQKSYPCGMAYLLRSGGYVCPLKGPFTSVEVPVTAIFVVVLVLQPRKQRLCCSLALSAHAVVVTDPLHRPIGERTGKQPLVFVPHCIVVCLPSTSTAQDIDAPSTQSSCEHFRQIQPYSTTRKITRHQIAC